MKVLILGGTGAIGRYLVSLLAANDNSVHVTSRSAHQNSKNIKYIMGNAHSIPFISEVCSEKWDAIVDFMSYKTDEFKERHSILQNATKQYIYISSSRVYADNEHPIKETSPRLLDVCSDKLYLTTDEYALTKARQENILFSSDKNNYTIIRPYITYGTYRYQLGVMEKEEWLYRALHGRTILFPYEIYERHTTITYGYDVAYAIYKIIGNPKAIGQVFHITNKLALTWRDVFEIYKEIICDLCGITLRIKLVSTADFLTLRAPDLIYQLKYDRMYDRLYDTEKETDYADADKFLSPREGLEICLKDFISNPIWRGINWTFEARKDKLVNERASLSEINGYKNKIKYFISRYLR